MQGKGYGSAEEYWFVWDEEDGEYDSKAHKIAEMLLSPDERTEEWKGIDWFPGEEGDTILDVACGNGNYYPFFTEVVGLEYTGCDLSENMVAICKENYPDGEFIRGDAADLPFEDNEFDIVFCSDLLLHVPVETQEAVLAELWRVASKYVVVQTRPIKDDERLERIDDDGALFRHELVETDRETMEEFDEDVEMYVLRERQNDTDVYWVMEVRAADEADSAETRSGAVHGEKYGS